MTEKSQQVCVYLFDAADSRTLQEKLKIAVDGYCYESGTRNRVYKGYDPDVVFRVERTVSGKPFFPECPQIHFSISHSGAYWACAIAGAPIGLDLQQHVQLQKETAEEAAVRYRRMAHRFFHPAEAEYVCMSEKTEPEELQESYRRFFTVWAAREAYVKYTGQGIDKDFSEHCVIPAETVKQPCLSEEGVKQYDKAPWVAWQAQGQHFQGRVLSEGYTMCLCMQNAMQIRLLKK